MVEFSSVYFSTNHVSQLKDHLLSGNYRIYKLIDHLHHFDEPAS